MNNLTDGRHTSSFRTEKEKKDKKKEISFLIDITFSISNRFLYLFIKKENS